MLLGVCLLLADPVTNLHEKWETIMGGSCFLLPHGAQYDDNPLPRLIRPWNHRRLLVDPVTAQPYPMVEVGSNARPPVSWHCGRQLRLLGRCAEVARGERLPSSEIYRAWSRSTSCHQCLYHCANQWCK